MGNRQSLRNFVLIILGNSLLGAPMPMLIILGGLAGLLLAPASELATIPISVQILAGLVAAAPISLFMGKYGRRAGFLVGAAAAIAGLVFIHVKTRAANMGALTFRSLNKREEHESWSR